MKERGGIGKAAKLRLAGVVFGDVAIGTGAQEDLLDGADEGVP